MNPIAPGASTNRHDRIADSGRHSGDQLIFTHEANTHRIHQRVAFIRGVKDHLTANRRHADAVSIVADAFDDAGKQPTHAA